MALSPRLEIRQGQSLVITPQLQQAIKLLQLSNLELDAFVDGELERNPLLSREDAEADTADRGSDDAPEVEPGFTPDDQPGGAAEADMDVRHDDIYVDASPGDRATGDAGEATAPGADAGAMTDWSKASKGGSFETDGEDFAAGLSRDKTLHEHLRDQLAMLGLTGPDFTIASVLIDAVDEGGYLRADLLEVAERLGCDPQRACIVLGRLQGFDPTGVFARDVRECLALQLRERDRLDPAMQALLDNLDLLARRDLSGLRRVCGVDEEDVREMIAEVRALTPRPGAAFGSEPVQGVTPDVFVREDGLGLWKVELNADTLPKLLVDRRYHARVSGAARSDAEKTFVSDCFAQANWLVKSLDQRARTILKVSSEIVRQQDAFLALGVEHLRPLNLKTVADAIGMHESTVSRVTSNKYMATQRGVFELKFFFTSSIAATDGGEAYSAEAIRHRIRVMIDSELDNRDGVLSDDRIVEILKETGVDIARRTVAKYREAMRIPSSVERRRLAQAAF
ncbi:RNA polymerase factor sigma-54 [Caulobacter sp. S45]|uniref:RNA polymerase factor sigma-54 n=1 Tax=Caulobacter sp. S45 TaxID=1641861 RepID=UPI00131AEBD5|nr:RNA polymerase factor sigma-54 [Caulobacter sp. S45]